MAKGCKYLEEQITMDGTEYECVHPKYAGKINCDHCELGALQIVNRDDNHSEARSAALTAQPEAVTAMLLELFDAHYGVAYHHCGDGDGLEPDTAAKIVAFVKAQHEAKS